MLTKRIVVIPMLFLLLLSVACAAAKTDDNAIENNVRSKITESMAGRPFQVEVKVSQGVVTLNGHAQNEDDRRAIGDAANGIKGVRSVINNITIEP
jgi:hyperosmotically inducible protein